MIDKLWGNISFLDVNDLYGKRFKTHLELSRAFQQRDVETYTLLALGISDASGNYSAAEHGLGPRILQRSTSAQV